MELLFGILGTAVGLGLFFAGAALSRGRGGGKVQRQDEEALRALKDAQAAFHALQCYSAEQAYGLTAGREERT